MGKRPKDDRPRHLAAPSVVRPRAQRVGDPAPVLPAPVAVAVAVPVPAPAPRRPAKKCCRSLPRCKSCPVVLMRATRLQESGLTGKDLKKAVKRARAA